MIEAGLALLTAPFPLFIVALIVSAIVIDRRI